MATPDNQLYMNVLSAHINICTCLAYRRYYDGQLISDDEMAPTSSICRDIVLAAAPTDAPTGTMPLPKAVGAAAAGINAAGAGGGSGVLLCRAYSEDKLYTQVR